MLLFFESLEMSRFSTLCVRHTKWRHMPIDNREWDKPSTFTSTKAMRYIVDQRFRISTESTDNSEEGFGLGGYSYFYADGNWVLLAVKQFLRYRSPHIQQTAANNKIVVDWEYTLVRNGRCFSSLDCYVSRSTSLCLRKILITVHASQGCSWKASIVGNK